jgi:DNA-binding HxlR family transcriptional regulator
VAGYGQFCPVAKASEVFAERWTPLVIRELIAGSHRFNEIRRGVPLMSPSLLSQRLKSLERAGIVERREDGRRGVEYHLTPAGAELRPVVELLGVWGQRWVTSNLSLQEMDPLLLMWDMRRKLNVQVLPPGRTVVFIRLRDQRAPRNRGWLVVDDGEVDLCMVDPGYDVDVVLESDTPTLVRVWIGHLDVREAMRAGDLSIDGPRRLARVLPALFLSPYAKERLEAGASPTLAS